VADHREPTSAPLSPLQKRPSVRNPLTPAIGGKNRGRLPRALSAPLLASLALRYRIISHNSARIRAVYIRTRQPRAPLHQGLEREHRGELHPRAGLRCVWEPGQHWHRTAHGATTSTPAKRGQHRHRTARIHVADYARPATLPQHHRHRSRAITSAPAKRGQHRHRTARIHVADYARPATLPQHHRHRSRAITSAPAKRGQHRHRTARGRLRQTCRVGPYRSRETYRGLPRTSNRSEPGQGDRGLKIYRSAGV
jgi:hypothetical protein